MLGKVMVLEEARARLSQKPQWDLVVLDAPATGHGLAFLKVPLAASAAVPVGPVGHNARRVLAMLRDPARTALVVVAIPEEMAVVEAVQFHRLAAAEVGMEPAAMVLNGCHERRFTDEDEAEVLRLTAEGADGDIAPDVPLMAALRAARRQIRRRKLTRFYQARLRRSLDTPLVSLPFLFREALGLEDVRAARPEARGRLMPSRLSAAATLERALATKRILVACGSGGVGKTTTAAALALRAARSGRRVLVCTIDPSRRLATSLGLNQLTGKPRAIEIARLTPPPARGGALWAMVLDVKSTFDALVARHTPDAAARERILGNRFYRHVSAALAGSHEYMAMEKLLELSADERWDLVVLDTPPTRHALDFLEAPDRLVELPRHEHPAVVPASLLRGRPADAEGGDAHRGHRLPPGRPLPRPAVPPGPVRVLPGLREHVRWLQGARHEGARAAARAVLGLRDGGGPDRARARGSPLLPPAAHGEADELRRFRREPRAHRPRARGPLAPPGAQPASPRSWRRASPRRCASSRCWPGSSGGRWRGWRWTPASGPCSCPSSSRTSTTCAASPSSASSSSRGAPARARAKAASR